jgi:predicted alpha/beta hydrolase family esterase
MRIFFFVIPDPPSGPASRACKAAIGILAFVVAWLMLAGGCARLPDTGKTLLKPKTFSELQGYLHHHKADLEQFRLRGPFDVDEQDNYPIRLSTTELIKTDLFVSSHAEKAPLVIILHGHYSSKEAHTYQAMHLASWGMHSLTQQLPNNGPWISNGKTLAKIVNFIHRWPETIDSRIDVNNIILVGHSFGGAAVMIALAEGAPAAGAILLDPAYLGSYLSKYLRQINTPVMLLGADEHVSLASNRDSFYRYIRSGISEVSIKDAVHEDAQYPSEVGLATEELQITFVSALTSAAFSLSSTGSFDYAWTSFGDAFDNGKLFNAKKK